MAEKPRTVGNAGSCVRRLRRVALKSQSWSSASQLACIVLICMPCWGHATCNMTIIKRPPLSLSHSLPLWLQCTMPAANWTRAYWMATSTRRATSISAWASRRRQKPPGMTSAAAVAAAAMVPRRMCYVDNIVWPMRSQCCHTIQSVCRHFSSWYSRTDRFVVNSMT